MGKEIIYSFKEYQEKYTLLLGEFLLKYGESENIDFINNEIERYKICLKTVNLPIDSVFSRFCIIEPNSNLKVFGVSKSDYDVIFNNENGDYYYKIYNDIVEPATYANAGVKTSDIEKRIIQTRFVFPKIISFLETKKSELEAPQPPTPPEDEQGDGIETAFIFKNNFDSVSEKKVYDYFKQNLVDKKYITQTDLHTFLKLAFENDNKATEKISFIKTPIKKKVVSIFYIYFNLVAGKTHGRREDYLNLLRSHFIGFENYNIKNFSE